MSDTRFLYPPHEGQCAVCGETIRRAMLLCWGHWSALSDATKSDFLASRAEWTLGNLSLREWRDIEADLVQVAQTTGKARSKPRTTNAISERFRQRHRAQMDRKGPTRETQPARQEQHVSRWRQRQEQAEGERLP